MNKKKACFVCKDPRSYFLQILIRIFDFRPLNKTPHSRKGPQGLLSRRVILTAQIQVPVKVEPYFRCINRMQEKQVYLASGEHVQPQQNWDAIYSGRTLVIVSFHCAKCT